MTQVVAVLNPKGGSGKTTLTVNLARAFQLSGSRVLIVDSDPQGSAQDWSHAGDDAAMPGVVAVERPTLEKNIPPLREAFDVVLIDGAAKLQDMTASALKAADIVLIPVQPSAMDIWAATDLVELIRTRQSVTDGRPRAAFIVSRQVSNTRLASEIQDALAAQEIPIFHSRTNQRVIYAESISEGRTVLDADPKGPAAVEILKIRDELIQFMQGV